MDTLLKCRRLRPVHAVCRWMPSLASSHLSIPSRCGSEDNSIELCLQSDPGLAGLAAHVFDARDLYINRCHDCRLRPLVEAGNGHAKQGSKTWISQSDLDFSQTETPGSSSSSPKDPRLTTA